MRRVKRGVYNFHIREADVSLHDVTAVLTTNGKGGMEFEQR